jgi:hypothetical protein
MKLLNIVILSTYAMSALGAFDGSGPHGDGRFLASSVKGGKACPDGKFNLLEPDTSDTSDVKPKGYTDSTRVISHCQTCDKGTFTGIYGNQATGYKHAPLNRNECCFNEDLAVCQEMMRAYQEGCNSGGDYTKNSRMYKDDKTDNSVVCPA